MTETDLLSRPRPWSLGPGQPRQWVAAGLGVLWVGLLGVGFWCLAVYSNTPGETAESLSRWPQESMLPGPSTRPLLLLFAHPRCPCTRATLEQLQIVFERSAVRPSVRVLFSRPLQEDEVWQETELWRSAARLPDVQVLWDDGGREAARFGARTSGHVLLFAPDGDLLFSGGITPSRGHPGESPGRDALVTLLGGGDEWGPLTPPVRTDVFGCPLVTPGSSCEECERCR
ncbi:MAG: RedB protein [Planctomycetes bacterium]|nr:RedB protein [Planctomycetota bacterium]